MEALVEHLELSGVDDAGQPLWDAIIVGDGSGQACSIGFGSAAVLIDRFSQMRKLFFIAGNVGTVSISEIVPYIYALTWYAAKGNPGSQRQKVLCKAGRSTKIHIVTDSNYVAVAGNNPENRRTYRELWSIVDAFRASGYVITYHHLHRNVANLNMLVDQVSRRARLDLKDSYDRAMKDLRNMYPGLPHGLTIYDFSP